MSIQSLAASTENLNPSNSLLEDIIYSANNDIEDVCYTLDEALDSTERNSLVSAVKSLPDSPEKEIILEQITKLKSAKDLADKACATLAKIGDEIEYADSPIDGWKDMVMATLPGNCSVAFANDVEAALENIKSVY